MADAHKNFSYSTIAVAPVPATSGTAITVQTGDGAKFPAVPFNATIWVAGANPLTTNAEIVRVTLIATDVLTITRAQESSSARTIVVGDQIAATITVFTFEDLLNNPNLTTGFKIGGAAASRKMIVGDGTNFIPSTETWAVPGTSGNILTSDGTNWTSAVPLEYPPSHQYYSLLGSAIKAEPMGGNISMLTSAESFGTGQGRFCMVYLPKAATITGSAWYQVIAGVYTANNYNGFGLYSLSGGTMTLVASSTTDGNIWKATASTFNKKAFSATYSAAAGLYVICGMYSTSAQTTAPQVAGFTRMMDGGIIAGADFTNSNVISGLLSSQTALPTPTQAMSGLSKTGQYMGFFLY